MASTPSPLTWSPGADAAFKRLKALFTSAPISQHSSPARHFVVEVDALGSGTGAILSQRHPSAHKFHPCAFCVRRFSPAESNYDVRNQEFFAVVLALQEWRHWLEGTQEPFLIWTDHKNLSYLHSSRRLNSHQAYCSLFLSRFSWTLSYRPGSRNGKPDDLSPLFSPAYHCVEDSTHLP